MPTRQSSIQNNKYQVSHKYNYFSWWWAHSRPKHVEERNKHTKKNCSPSWLYLQDYTGKCGQKNIKFISVCRCLCVCLCILLYKNFITVSNEISYEYCSNRGNSTLNFCYPTISSQYDRYWNFWYWCFTKAINIQDIWHVCFRGICRFW